MNRRLILIHDKRAEHQDRGWAYDVPESSAMDSDCELEPLLRACEMERETPFDDRGYRRRGPFFYCCRCNGIFLEWETMPGRVITGMAERVDEGQCCNDCWQKIKYGIPIVPRDQESA